MIVSRRTTVCCLLLFAFVTRFSLAEDLGAVKGVVKLVHTEPGGEEIVVKGRDLSRVVIFLEPLGHQLPEGPPLFPRAIRQRDAAFRPDFLVVPLGQVVEFPNDDPIMHNVFSQSPVSTFNLGLYKSGSQKSVTFDEPGVVHFFCSIHKNMYGVIYVSPTRLFTSTNADGRFSMGKVPVGRYDLKTWHRRLPEGVQSVEVTQIHVKGNLPVEVTVKLGGEVAW